MKKIIVNLMISVISLITILFILTMNNCIGVSKSKIEQDARFSQKIADHWLVEKAVDDTLAALIFYDQDSMDYTISIYSNNKGISFGYFFIAGGRTNLEHEGIVEYIMKDTNDRVYLSMNHQQAAKIVSDDEIIDIDNKKPFVHILSDPSIDIKIYDVNGNSLTIVASEFIHGK